MHDSDRLFAGSIPELYDHYLGPLIFEPYARDLAVRLAALAPAHVLETAAGTGIATRAIASALPAGTRIVATDLNQPMLDFASSRSEAPTVTWRQADAQALPFASSAFDVVICQFGAMFFPYKRAAYVETRRVLRPGGRFVFSVWDRIERNELAHLVSEAVAALFPADPPRFLDRVPHGYHDVAAIIDELRAAGFAQVAAETVELVSRAPTPRHPAIGFVQGSPLRSEIEARDPARLEDATAAAARVLADRFGKGTITGRIQAHVLVATR